MLRLAAGAENEIDDNIKLLPPKFRLMVLEKLAIAKNFFRALRCGGFATMKDSNVVAALLKLLRRELSDKSAAADKKNFHYALLLVSIEKTLSLCHSEAVNKFIEIAALDESNAANLD